MAAEKSKIKNQKSKVQVKVQKPKKNEVKKLNVEVSSVAKTKNEKKDGLNVDVYDTKGKVVESIELPKEIFGEKVNKTLLAQAVRVYLANQRRGTSSTKTRGEVRGSTRKIYKQKGTGRARHGGIRAPIFVGGGIVFGPKPRDYSMEMPKKMRRKALFSALSSKLGEIKIVTGLEEVNPKTKVMVDVLKALDMNSKKRSLMLVLPSNKDKSEKVYRAAKNIEGVRISYANSLNAYDVLRSKMMIFPKSSIEEVKKIFGE